MLPLFGWPADQPAAGHAGFVCGRRHTQSHVTQQLEWQAAGSGGQQTLSYVTVSGPRGAFAYPPPSLSVSALICCVLLCAAAAASCCCLQILDDGRVTDNQGHTVSFKNCVIIMTSNLGSAQSLDACRRTVKRTSGARDGRESAGTSWCGRGRVLHWHVAGESCGAARWSLQVADGCGVSS